MNHFEEKHILSNDTYKRSIKYYGRYVDDTFILFDGTLRQLDHMVANLNKVNSKIQFTAEHEVEDSINFLDSTVRRRNGLLSYNIYRKPTTTNMTIHSSSFHPRSHKMAAFNCYVYRALRFPLSNEDRDRELDIIKHIAVSNGYKSTIVDDIARKFTKKALLPRPPMEVKKYVTTDFNNAFSSAISNVLKKNNMHVAFSTSNNLFGFLKPRNRPVPLESKSGVYRLTCGSCDKFYIGQTGRSFGVRFKEHLPRNKDPATLSSNYARHLSEENHMYTNFDTNCKPLHLCQKGPYMNTLEEYEIYKAYKLESNTILNDKLCFNTNTLYDLCMNAEYKLSR